MHLVGFIIEMYHDARSHERQMRYIHTRMSLKRQTLFLYSPLLFLVEYTFNPLNAELNPIRHLLSLLGAHHIPHFSKIRVNYLSISSFSLCSDEICSLILPGKR